MISVVIPTRESERLLAHTLAALVPGALDGTLREVIVTDLGSQDETAKVADAAGCRFLSMPGERGAALAAAAAGARADWLWFVPPGATPTGNWVDEIARFVRDSELAGTTPHKAAVFRDGSERDRTPLAEAWRLIRAAVGGRPKPSQGLLIAKALYRRIGAHKTDTADPDSDLLRRLGRRRIVVLACTMTKIG